MEMLQLRYFFENISVSWTVEETKSQYADEKYVEVSKDSEFTEILCKVSGKDVENSCTLIPIEPEADNILTSGKNNSL